MRQVEISAEQKAVRHEPSQRGTNKRMVCVPPACGLRRFSSLLAICLGMLPVITHTYVS